MESKLIDAWRSATYEEQRELLEVISKEKKDRPDLRDINIYDWLRVEIRWLKGRWTELIAQETEDMAGAAGMWQLPDGASFRCYDTSYLGQEFQERKLDAWKLAGEWAKANNEEAYKAWLEIENNKPTGHNE